jgi:uncharacterized protein YyaL (SSP411 family)
MNRLASENSPYLLQHADNPVDWQPWTGEALACAEAEDKPVFLSIGYSTCHWCHVMARECFEDAEVAEALNRDFIAIKVDREERPDIDQIYMEACQRLTGRGGWPLTIVMTPQGEPFYAATYLPKKSRPGLPGLVELLPWLAQKWCCERDLLLTAAAELLTELRSANHLIHADSFGLDLHANAVRQLQGSFDRRHGGFGAAPKFPRPHDLRFLFSEYRITLQQACLEMAERTLRALRDGGICDQLGGGFHRYATDAAWQLPHFEKMLYDQCGLVEAYLDAWQLTGKEEYAVVVSEVLGYVERDLAGADGGFTSAEDADSEGEEGKFYSWRREEIVTLLGDDAAAVCAAFEVSEEGNVRDEAGGQPTGANVLRRSAESGPVDAELCDRLRTARNERLRPHRDDKQLAAWNGMAISAFARAGTLLGERGYLERAAATADFVLSRMRDERGRLLRSYRAGTAAVDAFAEDYAWVGRGLLDLYAADYDAQRLPQALSLAAELCERFTDRNGALFDTATDAEALLLRPRTSFDGAFASPNAIAVELFARLALLTADPTWRQNAERLLVSLAGDVERYPAGYTQLLQSASWLLRPSRQLVIVGGSKVAGTDELLAVARRAVGQTVVLFRDLDEPAALDQVAPHIAAMQLSDGRATAYLCQGVSCGQPLTDANELAGCLDSDIESS